MNESTPLKLAVIGAGPVGLALALHAAAALPDAEITLFDARPARQGRRRPIRARSRSRSAASSCCSGSARGAPRARSRSPRCTSRRTRRRCSRAVSPRFGEPALTIRAIDEAVPMLGAVMSYGAVVAPLQAVWLEAQAREPQRLFSRFGSARHGAEERRRAARRRGRLGIARALRPRRRRRGRRLRGAAEERSRRRRARGRRCATTTARPRGSASRPSRAATPAGIGGVAYERFTRHGPAALLPLKDGRAGLVWCVDSRDDPVRELDDAQRVAVLNTIFHPRTPRLAVAVAAEGVPARPHRRAHAHRRPHRAHRQRRADAAPGRRPGPQPRHARRLRAGALARAQARRRRRPAPARMAARARPLGDDRRDRLPRPQLHLGAARRGDGARPRPRARCRRSAPIKSAIARQMMFGSR